jgi:uncharacterized membrane protein
MSLLVLGLVVFLGAHVFASLRGARAQVIARLGENPYRALNSALSLIGFALIVWGFSRYRADGLIVLWTPPFWTRHVTILLMWFAWVSFALSIPGPSRLRGWIKHPQLNAVKVWALAHLIANGDLGGIVLFGAFILWAGYDRFALRRRGAPNPPRLDRFARGDAVALIVGTLAWAAMIALHPLLIGPTVLSF